MDESDPSALHQGLIFLIVTAVLHIIPLITWLLVNKKNKLEAVCLFTIHLLLFIVFFSRKI